MLYEGFWGTSFGHKVVGNKNSILNMSIDTLNSFRSNNYVVDNIAIAVVGNIEESEVVNVFSSILENVPSNHYSKLNSSKIEYSEVDLTELGFNHESKQAIIGFTVKGLSSLEQKESNFCNSVFSQGVGGGMHSMLFDRVREELGLCYSVGAWSTAYKDVGDMTIYCMLDKDNINLAKTEIFDILDNVRKNGFDNELLDISKKCLSFNTACESETSSDYAGMVADNYFLNGCECPSYEDRFNSIKKITNEDIIEFSNKYFSEDKIKFVHMTPNE